MRAERPYSPAARANLPPDPSRVLVIGCGALARELVAVIDQAGLSNVDLTCLPATLHNRPGGIPAAVRAKIRAARPRYEHIFVAYADCGTGTLLDLALAEEGVERLPGAHCYEFYSGSAAFAAMAEEEPGTFYLTDFLARNFDRLVIRGLGLDRHPELLSDYFGNYRRLVYLSQTDDPALVRAARRAARRLGLAFEHRRTGYGELATSLVRAASDGVSGFAASATNRDASRSLPVLSSDSLQPAQGNGITAPSQRADLPPAQTPRAGRGVGAVCLPRPQRRRDSLPARQGNGTVGAAAPGPAPVAGRSDPVATRTTSVGAGDPPGPVQPHVLPRGHRAGPEPHAGRRLLSRRPEAVQRTAARPNAAAPGPR